MKKMISILMVFSVVSANAQMRCGLVLDTKLPVELLNSSEGDAKSPRRLKAFIKKLDLQKPMSELDLEYLVKELFVLKYGPEYKFSDYKTIFTEDSINSFEAGHAKLDNKLMRRLLEQEILKEGMLEFLKSRNLLTASISRLSTIQNLILESKSFQILSTSLGLLGVAQGLPSPYMPHFRGVDLSKQELLVLVEKGVLSREGRKILDEHGLVLGFKRDYELFARMMNRVSFALTAAVMMYLVYHEDQETAAEAEQNGQAAMAELDSQLGQIATIMNQQESAADIQFEVVKKYLEEKNNHQLTADELKLMCNEIHSKKYCHGT